MLKVPVTSLRRKMTLWLQQGVLREEPPGTFTVIEEEQKDRAEKVVLIDSDEEGDSAMASQADQKEEELQVRGPALRPPPGRALSPVPPNPGVRVVKPQASCVGSVVGLLPCGRAASSAL